MREGISLTAIFQIVIIFILLFTAIMAMTINNTKAFGVKDAVINTIEELNGDIDYESALDYRIVEAMQEAAYRIIGKCPNVSGNEEPFIGYDREGTVVSEGGKASICLRRVTVNDIIDSEYVEKYDDRTLVGDFYEGYYYQVILFYQLDLPIINGVYNFQTKGDTKIFYIKRSGIGTKVGV